MTTLPIQLEEERSGHMRTSPETKNFITSFAAFQAELKAIDRTAENPFFKSKYATLETVIFHLQPLFKKHGFVFYQSCSDNGSLLITRLDHVESGEWREASVPLRSEKDTPQGWMSALTYARRYGLQCVTGAVSKDEDDDGERAMGRKTERSHPARINPEGPDAQGREQERDPAQEDAAAEQRFKDAGLDRTDEEKNMAAFQNATCRHCDSDCYKEYKGKVLVTSNGKLYVKCKKCKAKFSSDGGGW